MPASLLRLEYGLKLLRPLLRAGPEQLWVVLRSRAGSLAASLLCPEYSPELLRPLLWLRQTDKCKLDFDLLGLEMRWEFYRKKIFLNKFIESPS
jgi:hypothetical protein